jgi:hypothetical protein
VLKHRVVPPNSCAMSVSTVAQSRQYAPGRFDDPRRCPRGTSGYGEREVLGTRTLDADPCLDAEKRTGGTGARSGRSRRVASRNLRRTTPRTVTTAQCGAGRAESRMRISSSPRRRATGAHRPGRRPRSPVGEQPSTVAANTGGVLTDHRLSVAGEHLQSTDQRLPHRTVVLGHRTRMLMVDH